MGGVMIAIAAIAAAALVVYVAVTHWSAGPAARQTKGVARATGASLQWVPVNALLHHMSGAAAGDFALKVRPRKLAGYGAQIPTIVLNPMPGDRFRISFWLEGLSTVSLGINVTELRPGRPSRDALVETVAVTRNWRPVSLVGRVTGRRPWTGLGLFVFDSKDITVGSSFAIRDLKVAMEKA